MDVRQIDSFLAVAEELHFHRAARRLGVGQPSLSKQIRSLEWELGSPLFYRNHREVRLSPGGYAFLDRARDLSAGAREAAAAVRRAAEGRAGKLEIAYSPALEIRVVPRVLRRFRRRFPKVDLRLVPQTSPEQQESLRNWRIDVGFMLLAPKHEAIKVRPVVMDRLILVAPTDHPLGKCPGTPLAKLQGEAFVILSRAAAPEFYDHVISVTRAAGVSLRIAAEASSVHEALGFVAAGLGVTLLPAAVRDLPWRGVSYCPVDPGVPMLEIVVASRKDDDSTLTRNFLNVVGELYGAA